MKQFDVIVIGQGSMGSAATYYLARRGTKVLGLEQFQIPHAHGSHTGQSRLIRKAYFEHPNYVPLLQYAYDNWAKLEQVAGRQLFYRTGLLYHGASDSDLIKGVLASSEKYHILVKQYTQEERDAQHPNFQLSDTYQSLFEADAGFILPEKTIATYYELALKAGATIQSQEAVLNWEDKGDKILVHTDKASYQTQKLVIAAGAWASKLLLQLAPKLQVTQQSLFWLKPRDWEAFSLRNFPCWCLTPEGEEGLFYGFPILPQQRFDGQVGLKIAYHAPEQAIDISQARPPVTTAAYKRIQDLCQSFLPDAFESILACQTCLYTYSENEDFIIDHLPNTDRKVTIACGFSGHGFKFVPMVGAVLADLALEGKTDAPIEFLSVGRYL